VVWLRVLIVIVEVDRLCHATVMYFDFVLFSLCRDAVVFRCYVFECAYMWLL
jgi:hypothetical protein